MTDRGLLALAQGSAALRPRLRRRSLAVGQSLFRQNDPVRALFVVERGRVSLVRHAPDGRRLVLFVAGPGDSFAEAALFAERYHCDAVAETATRVIEIPTQALRAALAHDPTLAERLLARLARQVQDLRLRLELRNIRSARDRVWHRLALDARAGEVSYDGPLKDVAAEIGLTHEAFYRALTALDRDGRIRRRGRRIVLTGK